MRVFLYLFSLAIIYGVISLCQLYCVLDMGEIVVMSYVYFLYLGCGFCFFRNRNENDLMDKQSDREVYGINV